MKTVVVFVAALAIAAVAFRSLRGPSAAPLLALSVPNATAPASDAQQSPPVDSKGPPPVLLPRDHDVEQEPEVGAVETVVSAARREHVRQLIGQLRPDQDDVARDVWVNQFAHLPDEEIRFLTMQSRVLSTGVGLPEILVQPSIESEDVVFGVPSALSTSAKDGDSPAIQPAYVPLVARAEQMVRRNLQNRLTVGYREQLRLTVPPLDSQQPAEHVTVYNFATGNLVTTGERLHVAILGDAPLFFLLEDGRLTRNGRFTRLADGRLGLQSHGQSVSLDDNIEIPDSVDCIIRADGCVTSTNRVTVFGTIALWQVATPCELSSPDGVYFDYSGNATVVADVALKPGALELSNVSESRNEQLMQSALNASR